MFNSRISLNGFIRKVAKLTGYRERSVIQNTLTEGTLGWVWSSPLGNLSISYDIDSNSYLIIYDNNRYHGFNLEETYIQATWSKM